MLNYATSSPSLGHTYGNMTAYIVEYIKKLFPADYFKTVNVSSTIAYKQFNIFQNKNTDFFKKSKPMLIVRPRVEIMDTDNFLHGTYLTMRITDGFTDLDGSNLQPFFYDKEKGIQVKYLLNRLKMFFDVTILVDTQLEQLNQANYLRNRVMFDRPFFLPVNFESNVSKIFFESISKESKIPMYDEHGSIRPFMEYVNAHACFPVTYKMKNSTGNDEFFRFYTANVDTTLSNLAIDDGSKKGFVDSQYSISFTISSEFSTAGMYFYFTRNKHVIDEIRMFIGEAGENGTMIPIFTFQNSMGPKLPEGWEFYGMPMYKVEKKVDEMSIEPVLNKSILYIIRYHVRHGIPINTFMTIDIYKDSEKLVYGTDYKIDFHTFMLTTYKTNKSSTYRMVIHVNTKYINELIADLTGFNEEK